MPGRKRPYQDQKPAGRIVAVVFLFVIAVIVSWGRFQVAPVLADPLDDAIVRCDPQVIAGQVGETITIDLYVENVVDLYGADVRPVFDTAIAQAEDADSNPGNGVQLQPLADLLSPDFVVKNEIDNGAGTVWYAVTQLNPSPEVSGDGPIARLFLQGIAPGSFSMPFDYVKLVRRDGTEIDSVSQPCTISFGEPSTNTPTVTSTSTNTLTPTLTPSLSPTPTAVATDTPTPSPTPPRKLYLPLVLRSYAPLPTSTATATITPSPTLWPTPTATPGVTPPPGSISIPDLDSINDIAVDPPTGRVYLSSRALGLVYVLDGLSNQIVAQIPVCDLPYGIALNSSTRRGYVACYAAGTLAVLDIDANSLIGQISVGPEPTYPSVVETTNRIYIPTHGNGRLVEIDGLNQTVNRDAFAGDGAFALVIDEDLNRAYVTARDNLAITTIDLAAMQELTDQRVTPGGTPFGLGFNADSGYLYVSSLHGAYETRVDVYHAHGAGLLHVKTLQTPNGGPQMGGRIGVNPGTNHLFLVNTAAHSVTVIDGANNSIKTIARFGMELYGVDVAVMSNQVYIGGRGQNVLWIIPDNF